MGTRRVEIVVASDGRVLREDMVKSADELSKFERTAKRMADNIKGGMFGPRAEKDMQALRAAITDLGGASKLTEPQLAALKSEIDRLVGAGARIPPEFAKITQSMKLDKVAGAGMDQAKQSLQGLAAQAGPAGAALGALGPAGLAAAAGLAAIGVVGGGVLSFLKDATSRAVEFGGRLQDMSENTEVSADVLSLIGGSKGVGESGLDTFATGLKKLNTELVTAPKQFDQLGLSAKALIAMKPEERFQAVAQAVLQLGNDSERAAATQALFGKSIPLAELKDLADLTDRMARADSLGMKMDPATAAGLKDVQDETEQLGQAWDRLWVNLGASIATSPGVVEAIRAIADGVGALASGLNAARPAIQELGGAIVKSVMPVLGQLVADIQNVLSGVGKVASFANAARQRAGVAGDVLAGAALNMVLPGAGTILASNGGFDRMGAPAPPMRSKGAELSDIKKPTWDPGADERARKAAEAAEKLAAAEQKVKESIQDFVLAMQKDDLAEKRREDAEAVALLNQQLDQQLRTMFEINALGNSTATPSAYASPDDLRAAANRDAVTKLVGGLGGRGGLGPSGLSLDQQQQLAFLDKMKASMDPTVYEKAREKILGAKKETVDWGDALGRVAQMAESLGPAFAPFAQILGGISGMMASLKSIDLKGVLKSGAEGGFSLTGGKGFGGLLSNLSGIIGGAGAALSIGKSLISLFGGDPVKKAQKQIGQQLGTAISRELAEAIRNQSKELGISLKDAALLNISKAMGESGKDPRSFGGQIESLMSAISNGSVPAAQGLEELGTSFNMVADAALKAGSVGDRALVGIIKRSRELGLESPEIKAFVGGQLDRATKGVGGFMASYREGSQPGVFGQGGIQIAPGDVLDPKLAQSQATIFSAVFWATVKEKGPVEAADAMRATLDSFTKVLGELGGDEATSAILDPIRRIMDLTQDSSSFRGAAEGANALREALEGVANAGYLTTEGFGAFQTQARAAFDQAVAGGATTAEAFLAIAPLLQSLMSASRNYGIELDDGTKALIEQAKASGVAFKEEPIDRMANAMDRAVIALEKMAGITHEVAAGFDSMGRSADNLPGSLPDYSSPDQGAPMRAGSSYPEYDSGTNYVPEDGWAWLHRGEAVVPASMNGGASINGPSIPGGSVTVIVEADTLRGRESEQRLAEMAVDAVVRALEQRNNRLLLAIREGVVA